MKLYLTEYINEDIYKLLDSKFGFTLNLEEAEIIITRSMVVSKETIDTAKNLKGIIEYGVGVDQIDLEYARSKNIPVLNCPGLNTLSVSELVIGLMISAARKFDICTTNVKEKGILDYVETLGGEISNKTVGFIGLGEISKLTAKMLKNGFGCEIIAYNRSIKDIDYIYQTTMDEVLERSDFIILGIALNDQTRGLIDLDKLKKMKKNAILVNVSRGAIVNHDHLVYALKNNFIKAYATDVFEIEPVSTNDELLSLNVVATPHIGGNTEECLYRVGMMVCDHIENIIKGAPLTNKVN